MANAFTAAEDGSGFQPLIIYVVQNLGRWPRLGWYGPLARRNGIGPLARRNGIGLLVYDNDH